MKVGLRHRFFSTLVLLCLVTLLGLHRDTWAAPLRSKPKQKKTTPHRLRKQPSKTKKTKEAPKKATKETPPAPEPPKAPPLKKPKPLQPAQITHRDPLVPLDQLVAKQHAALAPYVPFVQNIDVAVDYGRLAMNLWTRPERRYEGSLGILFRKNIQLSGTWGYNRLAPKHTRGNQNKYTVAGHYGRLGLDYFSRYNLRNNLYAGVRYGRSYFKNSTQPGSGDKAALSKDLKASWWELVIGSEHQLFHNFGLYAGLIVGLKGLGSFDKFAPATNYVVPGYGRTVQGAVPSLTLYIKYKISFLEKQITFD